MITATHSEVEQLYLAAELNHHRSICITACHSGDGVTSVATALAERYMLAGHSTLYVDLNVFNSAFSEMELISEQVQPKDKLTLSQNERNIQWIEHSESHRIFTGVSAPKTASGQLAYRDPSSFRKVVSKWLEEYDRVIIDTSPLLKINRNNIPAQSVASSCDSTLLVIAFAETTSHNLEQAKQMLSASSIELSGSVVNMKHTPSFSQELIRQINKLRFIPNFIREKYKNKIRNSEFLNLPL